MQNYEKFNEIKEVLEENVLSGEIVQGDEDTINAGEEKIFEIMNLAVI